MQSRIIKKEKGTIRFLLYNLKGSAFWSIKETIFNYPVQFIVDCNESQYLVNKDAKANVGSLFFVHFNGSESKKYVSAILMHILPCSIQNKTAV